MTILSKIPAHTVYTVTPDDHYYPNTTCHHCHNLQYYLLNITKYFTSNTQLLFLPGLHHLHTDLIIQNIHNISLIGNGTPDTVIIQCNSSVGITINNITNLTLTKLLIENCTIENNFFNIHRLIFIGNGIVFSHCFNVQLQDFTVYKSKQWYGSTILAVNVLGISSFINVTSHGLMIEYNEVKVDNAYNKLLLENYRILSSTKIRHSAFTIHFYQGSYKIEFEVYNTKFTALNIVTRLFKVTQLLKTFGNFIHFNKCIVEKFNFKPELNSLFYFDASTSTRSNERYHMHQVTFTNCVFKNNTFHTLFVVYGNVNVRLESCIFKYNQFQVIKMTDSLYQNYMVITNTSFYAIKSDSSLLYISSALHLEGPVIFVKLKAHRILYIKNYISCHNYIEFSQNIVSLVDHVHYIVVQENTFINMTNNEYATIKRIKAAHHYGAYTISNFTAPCYYQYTARGNNFDKFTGEMNFSIVYHNDISIYTVMTSHCRWIPGSAFNSTKPIDINTRLINSDFPLEYDKIICYCHDNNQENCSTDALAAVFPGQTISLSVMLNYLYRTIRSFSPVDLDILYNHIITVEINDDILPPTACKVAKVNELVHQIYYSSCSIINFTIVHNGLWYLHWCELFINIISTHQIDVYYIYIFPCPAGFVYQNGICTCDPILNSLLPVTTCDINHQTILRPAGSWLSAVTTNDSHQYHISPHCPLQYCLPQSSQLNFSTPNSQCQFNRSGLLCGHCQQGLSTVFGYYHCQHCSNVYLLLVIPIAVAGLVLVLLMFILNLTVTDGDINGFILYVNIIGINNDVFFQNSNNFWYTFISHANLDLGISTCFYNGMDDYAKMWLQLVFPAYLILIATLLIIASRHSTKVQRITAHKALSVLATLFLLSYTKILCTVSSVSFYYSTITHLPSGHTTLVWAVDANVPLFGIKYTTLFIVCLILFIILLLFNGILCFTKTAMRLRLVNHFKPLIDAYQGPYKYKYYYWTGLQLVMRAVFFGLSAMDRNINLTVSIILLAIIIIIQRSLVPFKNCYKNLLETGFLFNLLVMYTLSHGQYRLAVNIMITLAALKFLLIIIHHVISSICGGVIMYKLKNVIKSVTVKWIARTQNKSQNVELKNRPPEKTYNYQVLREPLVEQYDYN